MDIVSKLIENIVHKIWTSKKEQIHIRVDVYKKEIHKKQKHSRYIQKTGAYKIVTPKRRCEMNQIHIKANTYKSQIHKNADAYKKQIYIESRYR